MSKILSVIIPAANSEKTIERAINSVVTGDERLNCEIEIIVVVNNSTDKTFEIVKKLSNETLRNPTIRVFSTEPGRSKARNYGMSVARGKIGIFLDSDDELTSDFINHVFCMKDKIICEHSICYCSAEHVFENSSKKDLRIKLSSVRKLYRENVFVIDSVAFGIDDVFHTFDVNMDYCEDWKFWAQNFLNSPIIKIDQLGVKVHITGKNSMKDSLELLKSEALVRAQIHLDDGRTSFIRDSKIILNFLSIDHSESQEKIMVSSYKLMFKTLKKIYNNKLFGSIIHRLFERKLKKSIY